MSNESLSALLDGEVSAVELDRILADVDRSPALAERWSRLCLRREAHQGTRVLKDQACICAGVMAQLSEVMPDAVAPTPKVVELASRRRLPAQVWKPLAGFAAAASVAAVAVMVMQPGSGPATQPGGAGGGSINPTINVNSPIQLPTLTHAGRYQTVSVSPQELRGAWAQNDEANATQLRELVLGYNNTAAAPQNFGGNLRYASFGADYRYETADGQR